MSHTETFTVPVVNGRVYIRNILSPDNAINHITIRGGHARLAFSELSVNTADKFVFEPALRIYWVCYDSITLYTDAATLTLEIDYYAMPREELVMKSAPVSFDINHREFILRNGSFC